VAGCKQKRLQPKLRNPWIYKLIVGESKSPGITPTIGRARFQGGPEVAQIACGVGVETLDPVGRKLRECDHRQDAYDCDDDQKLDESETFSVSKLVYNNFSFVGRM
jgi:hypothetical protein